MAVDIGYFIKDGKRLRAMEDKGVKTVMVLGGSDTGKTTLVEALLNFLSGPRAIIDLDMGQSSIGVPTTVSWGMASGRLIDLRDIKEEGFYFTGALSPIGNLLPSVVGAQRLVETAREAGEKVVIDTTGLIDEPAGRALKRYKIDLLRPDVIIGLERERELSHILDPLRFMEKPHAWRIPVPAGATPKNRTRRMEWRAKRFREYFSASMTAEVSLEEIGVEFTREAAFSGLEGRAVSFRNSVGEDVCLGIIEKADMRKKRLFIRIPQGRKAGWKTLVIGSAVIDAV